MGGGAGMLLWPLGAGNGGDVTGIGKFVLAAVIDSCGGPPQGGVGRGDKSILKNVHYSHPHRGIMSPFHR